MVVWMTWKCLMKLALVEIGGGCHRVKEPWFKNETHNHPAGTKLFAERPFVSVVPFRDHCQGVHMGLLLCVSQVP